MHALTNHEVTKAFVVSESQIFPPFPYRMNYRFVLAPRFVINYGKGIGPIRLSVLPSAKEVQEKACEIKMTHTREYFQLLFLTAILKPVASVAVIRLDVRSFNL